MTTHSFEYLDNIDRVIVIKQGRIIHQGHFNDLKHLDYFSVKLNNLNQNEETKQNNRFSINKRDYESKNSKDEIIHRAIRINNDESKENIKVNWRSFYKFFFFSYFTIFAFFFVVVILIVDVLVRLQFAIYLLQWVQAVSKNFKNDQDKFNKVVFYKALDIVGIF